MKKTFFGLLSLTILLGLGVSSNAHQVASSKGLAVPLSNSGDAFSLLENQYNENESFVYTADLSFTSGQAGGLVFGASENEHYFVFNMDRYDNKTKLMYFQVKPEGGYQVDVLKEEDFIGNDKMTSGEREFVTESVRNKLNSVNLKIVLTADEEHAYAEFYLEGIKRFGVDSTIDLKNISGKSYSYEGGYLGINCFNSDILVDDIEIGASDYSYMSEQYRNQYHLSPFAKWTNDPNALVYYNGYYHVYYQTHPFGQYWGDMYWGHARSTDLIHWEFLPICLFPENYSEFGSDRAFMWSGCAVAYYKGMSPDIDSKNWFPNGQGNGIYAIFTRDGARQDQVIISSDDDGLTWTKREKVSQSLSGIGDRKIDYRDPKIFPLTKDGDGKVIRWGMTLSSYALNRGYFLVSENLLSWRAAGDFALPTPECIGVGTISDENGNTYSYLTNKSRTYMLGQLSYVSDKIVFTDLDGQDISKYSLEEMPLTTLDFGPDTYASQSFYIGDPSSEYYEKDLVINWFSGDLNASFCTGPGEYANIRDGWNGGFTMPVEYTVKHINNKPVIAQTPITVNNNALAKTNIVNVSNEIVTNSSSNLLEDVHTNTFELEASIKVNEDSPIIFKVNASDSEYMEFGWNPADGYYVDRSNHDSKGINTNIDYHKRYSSHILGDSDVKTFYVLSDNGGLEVFCEDFKISFYFVTIPLYSSNNASLSGDNLEVQSLKINQVESVWRTDIASGEGILRLSTNIVELDTTLCTSKYISAYYSGNDGVNWELISGEDVVNYIADGNILKLDAIKEGQASFKVVAGNNEEILDVNVFAGTFKSDFNFTKTNIKSGSWVMSSDSIIGENLNGNGFLLANETGSDFTYSTKFEILEGTAASLLFRSDLNMQHFLVLNYDRNERIVKLWNEKGEITRSGEIDISSTEIVLSVSASGRNIEGSINGQKVLSHLLDEDLPLTGYFGLNVFSAKVAFKSLSLLRDEYEYNANGLEITLDVQQNVNAIYNVTNKNSLIESEFYSVSNGIISFSDEYFLTLKETGIYEFRIVGQYSTFSVKVDVKSLPSRDIEDVTVEEGYDVTVYVGHVSINTITINGEALNSDDYSINGIYLTINKDVLEVGENEVVINDSINFTITVNSISDVVVTPITKKDYKLFTIMWVIIGASIALVAASTITTIIIFKKKRTK